MSSLLGANYSSRYSLLAGFQPHHNVLKATVLFFCLASAAVDINGGESWNGWLDRGLSNDLGIYGSGSTTTQFRIYTASFEFNGETPTGSSVGSTDLSGWSTGDRIYAIGIEALSGYPAATAGPPMWNERPFIKFDVASDSYEPASTVGGSDGQTSSGSFASSGDFNVQLNGDNGNAFQPNVLPIFDGMSGVSQTLNGPQTRVHARSFFRPDLATWQAFFNLDTLEGQGTAPSTIPAFSDNFRFVLASAPGADLSQAVLNAFPPVIISE